VIASCLPKAICAEADGREDRAFVSHAFEEPAPEAIRPIFEQRQPEQTLRVWVPGCATGEEFTCYRYA
jgi:hypothetical protein